MSNSPLSLRKALLLSFGAHLALALGLNIKSFQEPLRLPVKASSDDLPQEIEILPPAESTPEAPLALDQGPGPQSDKDCGEGSWYGGIGVAHESFSGELTEIFPGYAADAAGLMVGDIVLNEPGSIRGDPGTQAFVRVERNGRVLSFIIMRQKICFNQ